MVTDPYFLILGIVDIKIGFFDYEKNEHPNVKVRQFPELSLFKLKPFFETKKEKIIYNPENFDYSTEAVFDWLRQTININVPSYSNLPRKGVKVSGNE